MSRPNPKCLICRGRGWFKGQGSDINFGPGTEIYPCLECNPTIPPTRGEIAFLAFAFVFLFVLMLVGAQ